MALAILEQPEKVITKPSFQLIVPVKRIKLSPNQTITGNRYDIVLACQPDARDNYTFYDDITQIVEELKGLRIYSPHNDIKRGHSLKESVRFTVTEAIPRTRGVLVHLTIVTPEIQNMFDSTYLNNRPFLLFYSEEMSPFNKVTASLIEEHQGYRGEVRYSSEEEALEVLEKKIDDLIRAN